MVCGHSSDRYSVCGERPLAIAVMNAELPPFKNGEHNSESTSTIDRVITPLNNFCTSLPTKADWVHNLDEFGFPESKMKDEVSNHEATEGISPASNETF